MADAQRVGAERHRSTSTGRPARSFAATAFPAAEGRVGPGQPSGVARRPLSWGLAHTRQLAAPPRPRPRPGRTGRRSRVPSLLQTCGVPSPAGSLPAAPLSQSLCLFPCLVSPLSHLVFVGLFHQTLFPPRKCAGPATHHSRPGLANELGPPPPLHLAKAKMDAQFALFMSFLCVPGMCFCITYVKFC